MMSDWLTTLRGKVTMNYRFADPQPAQYAIERELRRAGGEEGLWPGESPPYVTVKRVHWRAKRHPRSLQASVYWPNTSQEAPLERVAELLGGLRNAIDVETIRHDRNLRPQVCVWFEAP